MSASSEETKISVHDDPETVKEKMEDAYCPEGETEDNGVLEYLKYLVFPILKEEDEDFTITRPDEYGGDTTYAEYQSVENDFVEGDLHPLDLKQGVGEALADILRPVRENVSDEVIDAAYPET